MKSKIRFGICFLFFLFSVTYATGLGVSGKQTRFFLDFEPGYSREDTFIIVNKEGYTSSYIIRPDHEYGHDLSPYLTIMPDKINDVPDGGSATFKVRLQLPQDIAYPGESSTVVSVEIDPDQGGFRAYPAIGIPYKIFVLYPYKYLKWSLVAKDMNEGEKGELKLDISNLGEPKISNIYANIDIVSLENNSSVATLRTNTLSLGSKENKQATAAFDSAGLSPGNYRAIPVLNWDGNISTTKDSYFQAHLSRLDFRIGTKEVKILNFTRRFETDSINQMEIIIESSWNTKIDNIYADINILEKGTGKEITGFRSLSTDLSPWELKNIYAYFDTNKIAQGDYDAEIRLRYEGAETVTKDTINIGKEQNAVTVTEIPGRFSLAAVMSPMNLLIFLLAIFICLNLYLAVTMLKKKKIKTDPDVIEYVKEMKKKYNDDYIKEEMRKKGWQEEKIDIILKEASKK